MPRLFNIGLTQWRPTRDLDANLALARELIHRCAADGADLIVLPENCLYLGTNAQMRDAALSLESPKLLHVAAAAREVGAPVILGGFKRRLERGGIRNTAAVFDGAGKLVSIYDKIHLFDARIADQSFNASSVEEAGSQPMIVEVKGVSIGLSICYDVRFPELYRQLSLAGAEVLVIPSAFTQTTGQAHWEPLLRARAIENGAFVVASATVRGIDGLDAWETYGHALAVDPWGRVLVDLGTDSPVARVVGLDLKLVEDARDRLPVLKSIQPGAYATSPIRTRVTP